MLTLRLILSNLIARPARTLITVCAILLSVSLVVSVTTGYHSLEASLLKFANQRTPADATVNRAGMRGVMDASVVAMLRADPDVASAAGRFEYEVPLQPKVKPATGDASPLISTRVTVTGITLADDKQVSSLPMTDGKWFSPDEAGVVIDQVVAQSLALKVGDVLALPGVDRIGEVRVTGIVKKPDFFARLRQTVYVPLPWLQTFAGDPGRPEVSKVFVDLKPGADEKTFVKRATQTLATVDPTIVVKLSSAKREEMDKNLEGSRLLSFMAGAVAMMAATMIVFSSLSMGVTERQRTLAMMRAIGAEKLQIGVLVVVEGLALAAIGVVIGVPLGMIWVYLLNWMFKDVFAAGVVLSWGGVWFAAAGSILAAAAASILPAWSASRVDPLEAMATMATPASSRVPMICFIAGVLLAAADSVILFGPFPRTVQFYTHFSVGLPLIAIGFFLITPMAVIVVERIASPIAARLFAVRPALLRQQLASGIWRSAGTCAALMIGLAILVVMQTQARTMMGGWKIPDRFPDMFLMSFKPNGLNAAEQEKLASVPGLVKEDVMPLALAVPNIGSNIFRVAGAAVLPDTTMFFGVDPDKAFRLMDLDFRQGSAKQAAELLKKGRHVLVTQEYYQLKGLGVGGTIKLETPRHGTVDYTIAGVVWSPGMDVVISMFDLGIQMEQRTVASLFGTLADAKEDFGAENINLFMANLRPGVNKKELAEKAQAALGIWGIYAGDVREIKHFIETAFGRLLAMASIVAWAAMGVAALGVTNTILASVRSRQWQFGILRSIGVTRGGLLRMVLAEATMLAVIGCALGLGAGLLMAVNAKRLVVILIGYNPASIIPVNVLLLGCGVVIATSLLAAAWPAIATARKEPLELLQAGRAAG